MNPLHLLLHCPSRQGVCRELLRFIESIDPHTPIKRDWDGVIGHMEDKGMASTDVVIDVLSTNGGLALRHLRDLWELRIADNYQPTPVYIAVSSHEQPASLRYEIRRLGGRFLYLSDIQRHLAAELEEVSLQLHEVRRSLPRWEIVEESLGVDARRAYVFVLFDGKAIPIEGSDRHQAVLSVALKNNGIPRSMKALRQLCSEDPLFAPSGSFAVPQLATLKMYLYRDYPKHLQRAFDAARCGYRADKVIEHVDLGAKAMGFRIRGISKVAVR